jgi:hypothetical protein
VIEHLFTYPFLPQRSADDCEAVYADGPAWSRVLRRPYGRGPNADLSWIDETASPSLGWLLYVPAIAPSRFEFVERYAYGDSWGPVIVQVDGTLGPDGISLDEELDLPRFTRLEMMLKRIFQLMDAMWERLPPDQQECLLRLHERSLPRDSR